jgi:MoaA/NifB/PqqE/SkfB family radical SAM enzyme
MIRNCTVVRQPSHDVFYDSQRGEIAKITPATEGRRPDTPTWLHANLQLTLGCDLACRYCRTSSSPRLDTSRELDTNGWIELFDRLRRKGVRSVFATGGEIFNRPDIWDLLTALEERFMVHILTNGQALSADLTDRQLEIIARLASVQVSLDSNTPDLHDSFRGKGTWDKAIQALKRVRGLGVEAVISSVMIPGYEARAKSLAALSLALGVKLLLRPLLPEGRGKTLNGNIVNVRQIYSAVGFEPYTRGFLAYSEELYQLSVKPSDVPICGVLAFGPLGESKALLDT